MVEIKEKYSRNVAVTVEEETTEGDDYLYLHVWSFVLKIFALTLITTVSYIMSLGLQSLSEFKIVLPRVPVVLLARLPVSVMSVL